jgi:hypothetical protein
MKKLFAWCAFAILAGCYNPNVPDGQLPCGTGDNSCPSGLVCGGNQFCYHSGSLSQSVYGTGFLGSLDLNGKMGTLTFNTETGEVRLDTQTAPVVGAGTNGFQKLVQPSGGPPVALWNFTDVNIPALVHIKGLLSPASVLAIAATGSLVIKGGVDVSGGGGPGGLAGNPGRPSPGAMPLTAGQSATPMTNGGGGGGGYGTKGQNGGGATGGAGGIAMGAPDVPTVFFGSGGAGGGQPTGTMGGVGGAGGRAIVLLGGSVELDGVITADGGDGLDGTATAPALSGGGGGGAGGSILIVGRDQVKLDASHQLTALGHQGGTGGNAGGHGGAGGDGRIAIDGPISGSPLLSTPAPNKGAPPPTFPR